MAINRQQRINNILAGLNPLDAENRRQFKAAAKKEYALGRDD